MTDITRGIFILSIIACFARSALCQLVNLNATAQEEATLRALSKEVDGLQAEFACLTRPDSVNCTNYDTITSHDNSNSPPPETSTIEARTQLGPLFDKLQAALKQPEKLEELLQNLSAQKALSTLTGKKITSETSSEKIVDLVRHIIPTAEKEQQEKETEKQKSGPSAPTSQVAELIMQIRSDLAELRRNVVAFKKARDEQLMIMQRASASANQQRLTVLSEHIQDALAELKANPVTPPTSTPTPEPLAEAPSESSSFTAIVSRPNIFSAARANKFQRRPLKKSTTSKSKPNKFAAINNLQVANKNFFSGRPHRPTAVKKSFSDGTMTEVDIAKTNNFLQDQRLSRAQGFKSFREMMNRRHQSNANASPKNFFSKFGSPIQSSGLVQRNFFVENTV